MLLRFASVLLCCSALFPAEVTPGPAPAEVYVKSFDAAYIATAIRKPPNLGPLPAILFIHGGVGGGDMPAMKASTRQPILEHFYKLGYVVMSADYRRYHFGEDEIQDILAAYRKLESYPFVDKSRIAIIGGSHGGYLALMLATRIRLNAVVSMAGLVDIEDMFFDYAQEFRKTIKDFDDWRQKLVARDTARGGHPRLPDRDRTGLAVRRPPGALPRHRPQGQRRQDHQPRSVPGGRGGQAALRRQSPDRRPEGARRDGRILRTRRHAPRLLHRPGRPAAAVLRRPEGHDRLRRAPSEPSAQVTSTLTIYSRIM